MEQLNDVIYSAKRSQWHNTDLNYGLMAHLRTPSIPEALHRTTLPPVNKKVINNSRSKTAKVKSKNQNRRQFLRPGIGTRVRQRPQQQQPVARNALQMSLLLLSVLAFGTFATTSMMMRNARRHNRREQSTNRIAINKAPSIENEESSGNTSNTSLSFTYWASVFTERLWECIGDIVQVL